MRNKNIKWVALVTLIILLVPLLAMQFTDEVDWDLADFAVAGVLLFGAGLIYELISGKMDIFAYRAAVGLAVVTALFLIWINLAVGLIGTEDNSANLMYAAVLIVGILGAIFARFRPQGMALAMFVTALAQLLAGVIALISGMGGTLIPDLFFALLWFGSALFFQRAGSADSEKKLNEINNE